MILARENRHQALLVAIQQKKIHPNALSELEREKLTTNKNAEVSETARELFQETSEDAELQDRIDRYQKALGNARDLQRGEEVFRATCLTCHRLGEEGTEVGPSLGSLTTRPDESILIDLFDPSSKIDPEYTLYLIADHAGASYAGILSSESATSLTIRQVDGTEAVVLRKDIATMATSSLSLMPGTLHESISPQAASDLIGFLRQAYGRKEAPSNP